MRTPTDRELSQFLSLILRHKPETINLDLDSYGYANIEDIILNAGKAGFVISENEIRNVVLKSDKQRFKIVENRIKAIQGHSFEVLVEEQSQKPPDVLYHGTKFKLKEIIMQQGLLRMKRNFVHLYQDYYAAFMMKNDPIVFEINAREMYNDGFEFYLYNNVWQTKFVPNKYLKIKGLDEIDTLKKITITKITCFTKLINVDFKLDPKWNHQPSIYIYNCYLCGSKRSHYDFDKKGLLCEELTYDRSKKSHKLLGKIISFEKLQNEKEIVVKSIFEIGIKQDSELEIEKDVKFQGIGLRYYCPKCNELHIIFNLTVIGKVYKCSACNIDLLKIEKPTEIVQVTSAWE